MNLLSRIWSFITKDSEEVIQTFTYFIPAPPPRKSGYREKNFDGLIYQLSQKGFEIVDLKTQAISNNEQPGIFVILKLKAVSQEAKELRPSDFPDEFVSNSKTSFTSLDNQTIDDNSIELPNTSDNQEDEVEGIYYID